MADVDTRPPLTDFQERHTSAVSHMSTKWDEGHALIGLDRPRASWRISAIPLWVACLAGAFLFASDIVQREKLYIGPEHVFFCTQTLASVLILLFSLFTITVPIGFAVTKFVLWQIPPVRSALRKAQARKRGAFARPDRHFLALACSSALLILPIYAAAFGSKVCLSDTRIFYQPFVLGPMHVYDIQTLKEVAPSCQQTGLGGWTAAYDVATNDGRSFDLAVVWPWFSKSSDRILQSLRGVESDPSRVAFGCPPALRHLILR